MISLSSLLKSWSCRSICMQHACHRRTSFARAIPSARNAPRSVCLRPQWRRRAGASLRRRSTAERSAFVVMSSHRAATISPSSFDASSFLRRMTKPERSALLRRSLALRCVRSTTDAASSAWETATECAQCSAAQPTQAVQLRLGSLSALDWTGLDWAGLGWAGLGWAGLGWAGLGWAGLGWAGLGCKQCTAQSTYSRSVCWLT